MPAARRGLAPGAREERGAEGSRIFEAMGAPVNGEVIFLSDVIREACVAKCGVFPGDEPVELSLSASRDRLGGGAPGVQGEGQRGTPRRRPPRAGTSPADISEGTVRKELLEEKAAREIRNWFDRATSKSRILLSPQEER